VSVARISFGHGALLMPARTAYDQELIFQEAESYARRHGRVKLELRRKELLIGLSPSDGSSACDRCSQHLRTMVTVGTTHLCVRCARERVC